MKKQVFSLLLSAGIFTTSPLFGMESEDSSEKRAVCKFLKKSDAIKRPTMIFYNKGLEELPKEVTIGIFLSLQYEDKLSVWLTSKHFNGFCEKRDFWEAIVTTKGLQGITIENFPFQITKDLRKEYHNQYVRSLFSDIEKNYTLRVSRLSSFMKVENPLQKTEGSIIDASYYVSIGDKKFQMDARDAQSGSKDSLNMLEFLDKDSSITFLSPKVKTVWRENIPAYRGPQSFGAFLTICDTPEGIKAFCSPEEHFEHSSPEILGELHFLIKQL